LLATEAVGGGDRVIGTLSANEPRKTASLVWVAAQAAAATRMAGSSGNCVQTCITLEVGAPQLAVMPHSVLPLSFAIHSI